MSTPERDYRRRVWKAKIATWLARRGSRNTGALDRWCRRTLARATQLDPERNFMRDEWIESDVGFDPEELDRYQRGEATE